jgi:hypothetical protein
VRQEKKKMSLQDTWNRYVKMNELQVIELTNTASAQYDQQFAADLCVIRAGNMFGFADYATKDDATKMKFIGNHGSWFNGPTKS